MSIAVLTLLHKGFMESSQGYGFSSSYVQMWELDHKECWVPKNWCFQTVVLEKTLESPLDCKEITSINPRGSQAWIFTGRTVAEAEAPILWPPDAKSQLVGKDPDTGKIEGRRKTEWQRIMVGWSHWLTGHEFEQTPGDSRVHGGLMCCSPWDLKESDTTEWLNSNRFTRLSVFKGIDLFLLIPVVYGPVSGPGGSDGKASVYNVGDLGLIPGSGRFPGEGNSNPLQYSCLENPMDWGVWCPWGHKELDMTEQLHFHFL